MKRKRQKQLLKNIMPINKKLIAGVATAREANERNIRRAKDGQKLRFERSSNPNAFQDGLRAYQHGKGPGDCPPKFKHVEDSWKRGFAFGIQKESKPTDEAVAYNGG